MTMMNEPTGTVDRTIGDFLETRAARRSSENRERLHETARRHLHWSDIVIICIALAALIGMSLHVSPPSASREGGAAAKVIHKG